uniref:(California timema) hypothetical protein n=1 Tax=Timema californicum TaxID=61474 RepID=A0A7R9P5D8_TIMCA|nr:unnamed protein product [Timema californicum]
MESTPDPELITRSLNFHGQPLQKLWEADLNTLSLELQDPDFEVYQQRQKHLSFQDRGKRQKLQQFIVKKASALFDSSMKNTSVKEKITSDEECYAVLPAYESFIQIDKQGKVRHFFQLVKPGDCIIGSIITKSVSGLLLKVICVDGEFARNVADLGIKGRKEASTCYRGKSDRKEGSACYRGKPDWKEGLACYHGELGRQGGSAFCPMSNIIPAADKKNLSRTYMMNDTVCCEVIEIIPDTDKLVCGMKGTLLPPGSDQGARLGLIHSDDFPPAYKKEIEMKGETYEQVLEKSVGFFNPNNINYLANHLGLGSTNHSNMLGLRGRFPEQDYASELRQVQASKWAFRSVAEGIEHFKSGRHSEAFQCLNKALNIDPRNVEGLVARGALYANSGSFQKAIEDFETALKLNPNHQNARKYMGETLVALGRSYEDENKFEDALKSYENCLALIPFHEEAQNSIEYLKNKILNSSKLSEPTEVIPGLSSSKTLEVKETLKQLLKTEEEEEKKDEKKSKSKKKKDRKSRKRRRRSSSSSSSSTSGSSRSSSSSSSSSSESSSGSSHSGSSPSRSRKSKKHKKRSKKDEKREKSLSPLSKRMALMDPSNEGEGLGGLLAQRLAHYNPPALPFSFAPHLEFSGQMARPVWDDSKMGMMVLPGSAAAFQVAPELSKMYDKELEYEQRVCRFLEQTKGDSEYEEKVRKFLEETARWKKERKAQEEKAKKKKKKEKKSKEKEKSKKKKRDDHDKKKKHKKQSRSSEKFDAKEFEEQMESKKFRDALRKELSAKEDFRKRKSIDDEEEFLYGSSDKKDLRMMGMDHIPDLDELESKLSAYYAKVEKDPGLPKGSQLTSLECSIAPAQHHACFQAGSAFRVRNNIRRLIYSSPMASLVLTDGFEKLPDQIIRDEKMEKEKRRHSPSPGKMKQHTSPKVMFVHHEDSKAEEILRAKEKKKMDMFAESPSPPGRGDGKGKLTASEAATVIAAKWKMQMNANNPRVKKREKPMVEKEPWEEVEEKRFIMYKDELEKTDSEDEGEIRKKKQPDDKFQRKSMRGESMRGESMSEKILAEGKNKDADDSINKAQQFVDKFQSGFRINPRSGGDKKNDDLPPLPPGMPPKTSFTIVPRKTVGSTISGMGPLAKGPKTDSDSGSSGDDMKKKQRENKISSRDSSRSRSRSREKVSHGSSKTSSQSGSYIKARSRSKSGSYERRRSRSGSYMRYRSGSRSRSYERYSRSRSRSHSYRSRSRSYDRYSRSRSRSEEGHYRRRSRSPSDDRRRRYNYYMNKYPGRYPRNRGTYYRPRFQNYNNMRGGQGNFQHRGRGFQNQKFQQNRNRPYNNNNNMRGRGGRGGQRGGRYFHHYNNKPGGGYRDYHNRRYESRGRSRDSDDREDRRSYSRETDDPMKKVDAAKEKINKYIEEENKKEDSVPRPNKRNEPLSEGEAEDDDDGLPPLPPGGPPSRDNYADRKSYEGKWAEKDGEEKRKVTEGPRLPPENSIDEMDKFLNKVKRR